jgi:hypothetical protein
VQLCYLVQIIGADVVPNIVPDDIPTQTSWWRPFERITVNDPQPMISDVWSHERYDFLGNLDYRDGEYRCLL